MNPVFLVHYSSIIEARSLQKMIKLVLIQNDKQIRKQSINYAINFKINNNWYICFYYSTGQFSEIHHVSISDPDSVYLAFVKFVKYIEEEQNSWNRRNTENFLDDNSIKPSKISKTSQHSGGAGSSGGQGSVPAGSGSGVLPAGSQMTAPDDEDNSQKFQINRK